MKYIRDYNLQTDASEKEVGFFQNIKMTKDHPVW